MYKDKKVIAIVLAAGSGSRMGFDKMLYKLDNKSVVSHSVSAFNSNDFIDEIVVTASTNIDEIKEQVNGYLKVTKVIQGGESRAKSVENALKYVANNSIVAVHDGARPYVSDEVINNIIAAAYDYNVAIPCVPVKDTIKVSEDGFVLDTPNRSALNITQTPQAFNTDIYKKLLCNNNEDFTDDAQLFENAGYKVKIINGEYKNIKLTTKEDLVMKQNFRIGHGYDVHKLVENRKFILGGVTIPYEKGLLGHSDADVLLHSIADSLLGALALGDIGKHFPDTSSEYKGADSLQLLAKVMELIRQKGYAIGNIDATVICQQPKLAPHIPQMIKNIAKTLQCDESCVSVKATTEEKLGFTGSGEGVSAHCVCILQSDS